MGKKTNLAKIAGHSNLNADKVCIFLQNDKHPNKKEMHSVQKKKGGKVEVYSGRYTTRVVNGNWIH